MREGITFLPYFSNGKGDYGNWGGGEKHGDAISMPYVILTEQAEAFVKTCYEHHFVHPFDWGAWAEKTTLLCTKTVALTAPILNAL